MFGRRYFRDGNGVIRYIDERIKAETMIQYLSYDDFRKVYIDEVSLDGIHNKPDIADVGYLVQANQITLTA